MPLTWNLTASFDDGATATGAFVFDADTGSISAWQITTTTGSSLSSFAYDPSNSTAYGGTPAEVVFTSNQTFPTPSGFSEHRILDLFFTAPLSDAGGTISLIPGSMSNGGESRECLNCDPFRLVTKGFASTSSNSAPTITSLSPASASADGAAFTLTVNGSNFFDCAAAPCLGINWQPASGSATFISGQGNSDGTQLTAIIPGSLTGTAGAVQVSVQAAGGMSNSVLFTLSESCALTYVAGVPHAGPAGGNGNIALTFSTPGCPWSVSSDSSWLVINQNSGAADSQGNASIPYTAAPLSAGTPRVATVTVSPGFLNSGTTSPFQISLAQNSDNCTFSLSPTTVIIPASGGNNYSSPLTVSSSPVGCWWSFQYLSGPTFVTTYAAGNPAYNGLTDITPLTVNFFADANTGPPRSEVLGSLTDPPSSVSFTVLQAGTGSAIQVSPLGLSFAATAGGAPPGSQSVSVSSTAGDAVPFSVGTDGGQSGTPAPPWLIVSPANGTTPSLITVTVNPSALTPNSYSGRIVITDPNDPTPIYVPVTLTVTNASPNMSVAPTSLSFRSTVQSPGTFQQTILVRNTGGSVVQFSVSTLNAIPWVVRISPTSGSATPNNPVAVVVQIDTTGLAMGGYKGILRFTSNGGTIDVPISLFVANTGPAIALSQTGLLFEGNLGQGIATVETLQVLDIGDPGTTVNFTASVTNGADWLTLTPASGTATASSPGTIGFTVNATSPNVHAGGNYALVTVSDPQSLNSPVFVTVVLNLAQANGPIQPDPVPQGLVFIGPAASSQNVVVNASSQMPVMFGASAATSDGGTWLSVSPASGLTGSGNPATVSVSADGTGLAAGVYRGFANVAIGTQIRGVNVTLIVPPATKASKGSAAEAACSPVVVTQVALANNFNNPLGYPATLTAVMNDSCGNPIPDGSATANFSNGDVSQQLLPDGTGKYSVTWQPEHLLSTATVTVIGMANGLQPGSCTITGGLTQNVAPMLSPNGTVHNFYPAGALSPGLIAQVYGSDLAPKAASPNVLPLVDQFLGSYISIGGMQVPLYYVSDKQINIEIPTELQPGQYTVIASVNGALSLSYLINLNPLQSGVAAQAGATIAQHTDLHATYVDAAHPAKPNEVIVIYLAGMGATNPPVASGQPAPSPPAVVVTQPVVTIGGEKAQVQFAGLTPGSVGLYQINFRVPPDARSGPQPLVVSQNGITSNTTTLMVGK